jgi:hypothetical protein
MLALKKGGGGLILQLEKVQLRLAKKIAKDFYILLGKERKCCYLFLRMFV